MSELKGSQTHANLKAAFAREAQNNQRYRYFAKMADIEGHTEAAALFRDIAEGVIGHAHGQLDFLREVGDPLTDTPIQESEDNLLAAMVAERESAMEMYPKMAESARAEGFTLIANWFENLAMAKASHASRFEETTEER